METKFSDPPGILKLQLSFFHILKQSLTIVVRLQV